MNTPHVVNAIVNVILIAVPCAYILYSLGTIIYFLGRQRGYKDDCDFVRKYQRDLDELYRACQAQRDKAQAEVVAAHLERDKLRAERDDAREDLTATRENLKRAGVMNCRLVCENSRVAADNARLIEENGKLIAASAGGIDGATAGRLGIQIGAARNWLEMAERLLPEAPNDGADDDDDEVSGEVTAAHRECDDGEDDE